MTLREFADLVYRMRQAQERYFRTRGIPELRVARDWENRVDDALKDMKAGPTLLDHIAPEYGGEG